MKITIRLKEVIAERGMSQRQLAEMSHIRPNAVSNLCRGTVDRLELEHVAKIATALCITDISEIIRLEA